MIKNPLSTAEILALKKERATVPLPLAGRCLGIGSTRAYELARAGQFPCRVLKCGAEWIVPVAGILEALGLERSAPAIPCHPSLVRAS